MIVATISEDSSDCRVTMVAAAPVIDVAAAEAETLALLMAVEALLMVAVALLMATAALLMAAVALGMVMPAVEIMLVD